MKQSYILRENLMRALVEAIRFNELRDAGNSAETQGWRDVLKDLQDGKDVKILDEPPLSQERANLMTADEYEDYINAWNKYKNKTKQ